jgi:hypothetical protein
MSIFLRGCWKSVRGVCPLEVGLSGSETLFGSRVADTGSAVVLVLRSPRHAAQQTAGLAKRLATAAKKLAALTSLVMD